MNVLIVGYGRMGREVEAVLKERGHSVSGRIDPGGYGDAESVSPSHLDNSDIVIEFSLPGGVLDNVKKYCAAGIPAVMGTTGWLDHLPEVEGLVRNSKSGFLYGSNFSIGAHIFFALTEKLTALTDRFAEYDLMVTEYHHKMKKDSPSGTALTTAERILANSTRKEKIFTDRLDRAILPEELHIASVRGGSIPGTHIVMADSQVDTLELSHTARSRAGLASGAVHAAEWLVGRKGFFTVDDFISDIFKEDNR